MDRDSVQSSQPELPALPGWIRPFWYGLCLAALGVAVTWGYRVVSEHTADEQRMMTPLSTVWGMNFCVAIAFAGLGGLAAPLLRTIGRKHLLTGLGLALLAFAVCGLAPQTNRIFYDEHIYMQIGQTLAHTGRAEYASYAKAEYGDFEIMGSWANKQPNGHPYFLSWPFRLFGASEGVAFATIRVAVAVTVAVLYFALVLAPWTLPTGAPLAVALCYIGTPIVLWWSRTVAVEPTAALATALTFFAVCLHAKWRDINTGQGTPVTAALLASTAAFAAYFRPESLLVYPMAAALLLATDRRFLEDRVTWAALALSLALITPNLLHLWSVRMEDWGASDGRRFAVAFLAKNLESNAGYFVHGKWFPLAGTMLACAGIGWLMLVNRRIGWAVILWFGLSWGIFVLFYAGGYYYGASSRYAVVSAAPVALLMGVGASALFALLRRQPLLLGVLGAALAMNWVTTMHFVSTLGRESNEARADIDFAHEAATKLPRGSLVISNDPCIWNMLGRNAAQLHAVESLLRTQMREMARQYPGGIYLHWDYWVNIEDRLAQPWRQLVVDTRATVFTRWNAEAVKFALFRLDTPYACEAMGGQYRPDQTKIDLDKVAAEALIGRSGPGEQKPVTIPTAPHKGTTTP
jgi:Dolichyl-phosphate-mannose-protein mannosyltransferase